MFETIRAFCLSRGVRRSVLQIGSCFAETDPAYLWQVSCWGEADLRAERCLFESLGIAATHSFD